MTLNNLAQRVEAACGADRGLDALIESDRRRWQAYACGLSDKTRAYWVADSQGYVGSQGTRYAAPAYTASIDAALTLVPDDCLAMVQHLWDGNKRAGHAVLNAYTPCGEDPDGKMWIADFTAVAATPALALCAAALRARQESKP